MTGVKFILVADLTTPNQEVKSFLKQLYEAFSDYVLKDPFYVVTIMNVLFYLNNFFIARTVGKKSKL